MPPNGARKVGRTPRFEVIARYFGNGYERRLLKTGTHPLIPAAPPLFQQAESGPRPNFLRLNSYRRFGNCCGLLSETTPRPSRTT